MRRTRTASLVTPTGAALLAEILTLSWRALGPFRIAAAGYGAGSRDPADHPNVLRALVVETDLPHEDYVEVLETNVDDTTGEVLSHTLARLMEEGARDAQALPALMKKGRMGYLVRVVCRPGDGPALARVLAAELGTLGVRSAPYVHRLVADRTVERIAVTIGSETRTIESEAGPARRQGIYLQTRIRAGAGVGARARRTGAGGGPGGGGRRQQAVPGRTG